MKNTSKYRSLPMICGSFGIAALILRRMLYALATDEKGLLVPNHPLKIALSALLFGFLRALGNVYSGFDLLMALNIPGVFYNMLPYLLSLVVLAFTSKKSQAPKAAGMVYDKGSR